MYHIFFIHSSVDKHLGCFHVLAIVHSAVMNTEVYVFFFFFFCEAPLSRSVFHGTEKQNQASFCPSAPREVSVLPELALGMYLFEL